MGILEGKNILVTGVTMTNSIAYKVAEIAAQEGATVIVSNFGRALSITQRIVKKMDPEPAVLELDVTSETHLDGLADAVRAHVDRLDGVVHSVAYANPETAMGGKFLTTGFEDVAQALHVSAYSLVSLTMACKPLFGPAGASVVGLTFDARVTWPMYDWMGVAKAALESASRYLSRYLGPEGVRCNVVAAGPLETIAKKAIPGSETFNNIWPKRAPLGWNESDTGPAAKAVVALLSDWFPSTTGEMIHVDGGVHATGA